MADYNSSLPVRTQNDGDVVAKIADATVPSQQLAVDAAGAITSKIQASNGDPLTATGTSLDVNITNSATSAVPDGTAFVADVSLDQPIAGVYDDGIAPLVSGNSGGLRSTTNRALHINLRTAAGVEQGNSNANGLFVRPGDGTNFQAYSSSNEAFTSIRQGGNIATVTAGQALKVDGSAVTQPVSGTVTASNLPATVDTNYGVVGASTLRTAAQIGNAAGAADFDAGATGAQTLRVEANQGAANAAPWNVAFAAPGAPVNDYKAAAAIASGASDNHDYTVTAGLTLHLNQVEASGSGKAKMLLEIETGVATGVFTTAAAQFNSTAETNMSIILQNPILVAAGVRVRIVMSNRDLLAQDLYSTICGYEI